MSDDTVGPVLEANDIGRAIVAAIRELNANVVVHDRGAYLRVLVPGRCVLRRDALERVLGRSFVLPGELELVMPSFKGMIEVTADDVVWTWRR